MQDNVYDIVRLVGKYDVRAALPAVQAFFCAPTTRYSHCDDEMSYCWRALEAVDLLRLPPALERCAAEATRSAAVTGGGGGGAPVLAMLPPPPADVLARLSRDALAAVAQHALDARRGLALSLYCSETARGEAELEHAAQLAIAREDATLARQEAEAAGEALRRQLGLGGHGALGGGSSRSALGGAPRHR
jgi:hypothetical protein